MPDAYFKKKLKVKANKEIYMRTKEEILQIIEEEDVEFIRLQFTDVWGNLKNIAITPGQIVRVIDNMYSIESAALFDGLYDYKEEIYLYPDLDSFVILPWRPQQAKVGKMICDVYLENGTPCPMNPRTILKNVVDKAKEEGYTFMVNPECEFFLFHTDDNGNPTAVTHERAGYLDVGPIDFGENARRDIVLTLEDMGFEIESSHHQKAPAQHEIDFAQDESLQTADNVTTFKFAVRSIAKRFGLYATFMPKPNNRVAGSGMHLNFSMYKDGVNLFEDYEGVGITDYAKYFMGGIMAHARGLCAITNPIVNSYKRLLSGCHAPGQIDWSKKGECTFIKHHRNAGETKVELRFPDPAANPYLAIAACIAAGLDGVKNKLEPSTENEKYSITEPTNLMEAIISLKEDKVIADILGDELVKIYSEVKTNEWNGYMLEVSDWEINRYLGRM